MGVTERGVACPTYIDSASVATGDEIGPQDVNDPREVVIEVSLGLEGIYQTCSNGHETRRGLADSERPLCPLCRQPIVKFRAQLC
jgi:hypothetical protein